jgi:hypothetical protein
MRWVGGECEKRKEEILFEFSQKFKNKNFKNGSLHTPHAKSVPSFA